MPLAVVCGVGRAPGCGVWSWACPRLWCVELGVPLAVVCGVGRAPGCGVWSWACPWLWCVELGVPPAVVCGVGRAPGCGVGWGVPPAVVPPHGHISPPSAREGQGETPSVRRRVFRPKQTTEKRFGIAVAV